MAVRLQKIIGVDKKNPYFSIYKDTAEPGNLQVFFGAALMEVVPVDKSRPEFKLLIARLYNAGMHVKPITETFGIARTTMSRWGDALRSGDMDLLMRALAGPGAPQKLTPEVRTFIEVRFPQIYKETHYNYSSLIRDEIKKIFGKDISSESLRPLFNELKKTNSEQTPPLALDSQERNKSGFTDEEHEKENRKYPLAFYSPESLENLQPLFNELKKTNSEQTLPQETNQGGFTDEEQERENRKYPLAFYSPESLKKLQPLFNEFKKIEAQFGGGQANEERANNCDLSISARQMLSDQKSYETDPGQKNHNSSLVFYSQQVAFCYHIGVLLFSNEIHKFSQWISDTLARQFLVTVLLGAKNIEQTKILDFNALRAMLGIVTSNRFIQRRELSQMAIESNINELLKFNAQIINAHQYTDFYYDPHVKKYTGMEKILKGWCATIKGVAKIINMDFIHLAPTGHPLYMELADNFHSMADRFKKELKDFRTTLGYENKILTFIFDRGIFSFEVFENIITDKLIHIITWEKGYKKDKWDEQKVSGTFSLFRKRNNSHDLLKYDFAYIDQEWEKKRKMRQLIIQATNPKGRRIEVSILTDDQARAAEEVIELMFSRWVQENDFKYENKHFGINEITTYSVSSYSKLKNLVEDKQTKRGEYKALERGAQIIKGKLKNALLKKHTIKNDKRRKELEADIEKLSDELDEIKARMSAVAKEGSKIEELIANDYKCLNTKDKKYMDYIKIIARNIFYKVLEPFKKKYDNYRDDHVIFRNLSQAHGLVSFADEQVQVTIFPTAHYQPKVRKIIEEIFNQINNKRPLLPDGSGRVVNLELGKRTDDFLFIIKSN
jgi:transposase